MGRGYLEAYSGTRAWRYPFYLGKDGRAEVIVGPKETSWMNQFRFETVPTIPVPLLS